MDKSQLTEFVIVPTLKEIPKGYSKQSLLAAQMVIAHESKGGEYISQKGNGIARGIIQMEQPTYFSTWKYGESCRRNAMLLGIIKTERCPIPDIKRLYWDLRFNIFMLRQRIFMFTEALPSDEQEMAEYLNKYWNGGGKATPDKYYQDYKRWR